MANEYDIKGLKLNSYNEDIESDKNKLLKNKIENALIVQFDINKYDATKIAEAYITTNSYDEWIKQININTAYPDEIKKKLYMYLNNNYSTSAIDFKPLKKEEEPPPEPIETVTSKIMKEKMKNGVNNIAKNSDDYITKVSSEILEAIKTNNAPWMKPWKADDYMYPHNPVSGNQYTGFNQLYLEHITQNVLKSNDPRWMTFNNIRDQKYHLQKGSKGQPIAFYNQIPVDENGKQCEADIAQKWKTVRKMYFVFHASQIDGIPPYQNEKSETNKIKDSQTIENAQSILTNSKANIIHDSIDRNYYSLSKDEIHLTPKHTYDTLSEYYCTALHELSHWTGHPSRLNREQKGTFGSQEYAMEELRAEIGSYMLCKELHLDFNPQNSIAYVKSWSNELSEKSSEIIKACHDASKIKTYCSEYLNNNVKEDINNVNNTQKKRSR